MIELNRVTKNYHISGYTKIVLQETSCVFPRGMSVGILGLNGAGKSTLMRLLDGTEDPTTGKVRRSGSISRLGLTGGFHPSMTGADNVKFVSRIYGKSPQAVLAYVEDFAELGDDLFRPMMTYSSGMKARLKMGLSLAMKFDLYLVDEGTSAGDARFQERCRREMKEKLRTSDVIMVSHTPQTLVQFCTHGAILHRGRLTEIVPLEEATIQYRKLIGL